MTYNGANVIYQCASGLGRQNANDTYTQEVTIPSNEGGDVYLEAGCGGAAGYSCDANATNNMWSQISLSSAVMLLSNSSLPAASGFTGTLLGADPPPNSSLLFTATDPNGPGVYGVNVTIDGSVVYSATPNTNSGECVAVGTDASGALEFDYAQPCPQQESVDIPVNTANLSAGNHELVVSVTDAAQNSATVLDQEITIPSTSGTGTTSTPTSTAPTPTVPPPTKKMTVRYVKAQLLMSWSWTGLASRVSKVRAVRLPRTATVTLTDAGPRHPKITLAHATERNFPKLVAALKTLRFYPSDTLTLAVSITGEKTQRTLIRIRKDKTPTSTALKYR